MTATAGTNWGRWGPDDERGALNLVGDHTRKAAAELVRTGKAYPLAHPVDERTPHTPGRHAVWQTTHISRNPKSQVGTIDDILTLHTHIGTHLDALCHYWGPEGLYNGFDDEHITSNGAPRLGVHNVEPIVTRAVVVDLTRRCPAGKAGWGHEVTVADLTSELDSAGISLSPGDAVLLGTGWERELHETPETYTYGEPGIGPDAAEWLAGQDPVLIGADTWAVEAVPPAVRGVGLPVHRTLLNRYGVYILENLSLGTLLAERGTCAGLLVVAPLLVRGGAGSPVTPVFVC
ncbi:MAG TPA: cyclase family protein [Amycolatopsis sp.]|nr:cyclase family protein [Amycolatopsis sp.]